MKTKQACNVFFMVIAMGFMLFGGLFAAQVFGQGTDEATWIGGGTGNWNQASNWRCNTGGINFRQCVPSAGFDAGFGGISVTLDQSATVDAANGGSLTIPGTSLTLTNPVSGGGFDTLTVTAGGSVTSASQIGATTLNVNGGTLTAPSGLGFFAPNASIQNGTINTSLSTSSSLLLDGSQVSGGAYASGTFNISGSTITGGVANLDAQGASTIANSTITESRIIQ
ncbi:MAG: hypothetical protein ACRD1I_08675 [Terriglobia bacterium]